MIKWRHWPAVNPGSPRALAEEWLGSTKFGTIQILRMSHKTLGTPWRIKYPNGETQRAENVDAAKRYASQWVALQYQRQGGGTTKDEPK